MALETTGKHTKLYTFRMSDAYGDNYTATIAGETLKEARSTANTMDDDAVAGRLLKVVDKKGDSDGP